MFKNGLCYMYEVVTDICFYVTEESNNHDVEPNDVWRVTKGCYNGEFTKMEPAKPDVRYAFSEVQIELRIDPNPPNVPTHDHHIAAKKQ